MTMKKLDSVIGMQQLKTSLPTGNHDTEAGAIMSAQELSAALTTLRSKHPKETDKALLTSLQRLRIFPIPTYNDHNEVKKYYIGSMPPADYHRLALIAVEEAFVPMPEEEMAKSLLTAMMLMVKPSGETPEDVAMRVKLYARQMQEWPADIFLKVLDLVTKRNTFWPAFSDFYKEYEWLARNRLKIREALHLCMK